MAAVKKQQKGQKVPPPDATSENSATPPKSNSLAAPIPRNGGTSNAEKIRPVSNYDDAVQQVQEWNEALKCRYLFIVCFPSSDELQFDNSPIEESDSTL